MNLRLSALALALAAGLGLESPSSAAAPAAGGRPIDLQVDATEAGRRILHAKLDFPVAPGPLTLLYPKWIPGEHGPTGPVADLVGLRFSAGGRSVPWERDDAEMYAFLLEVPAGTTRLEASLDFVTPPDTVEGFSSAASATTELAILNWNQVVLYPAGPPVGEIRYRASLTLPAGWKLGTALPVASSAGPRTVFEPVSLETLVDSPVICGAHFRELPIGKGSAVPHFVEMAADSEEALEITPQTRAAYDRLVAEAEALFGARHYRSYRFLLALSDRVAHFGLEHHESSDDRVEERALIDEDLRRSSATLLPHEFVHSWNGKYRRPADIATPDYQRPMRTSLLWIYEGLTQYLGQILAARSGLWGEQEFRDKMALIAAWAGDQGGRSWRPLVDTAVSAQVLFPARRDWEALRRSTDFYDESVLIWLDADTLIREGSGGKRSLEDFIRAFHGGENSPPRVAPYTRDELLAELNRVWPHDWAGFFRARVDDPAPRPPLAGLERSGWRLVFTDTPSLLQKSYEKRRKEIDLSSSLGMVVGKDGLVKDVIPGRVADRSGLGPGMTIRAVNSRRLSDDHPEEILQAAVAKSRRSTEPLELIVESGEYLRSLRLDYHEGARFPRLERIPGKPDLLSDLIRSRTGAAAGSP